MYRWRKLNPQQRQALLNVRQREGRPWHSPAHYNSDMAVYMITAPCYEHQPIIGDSVERMRCFQEDLLNCTHELAQNVFAWNLLPNHYHLLVRTTDVKALLKQLGKLHGRTSYLWNGEDGQRGRKVRSNSAETAMKSERHLWASLNYVLNNAVHHGYVERWQDWPFSNATEYLALVGREEAQRRWRDYPVLDYGKDWDPPGL